MPKAFESPTREELNARVVKGIRKLEAAEIDLRLTDDLGSKIYGAANQDLEDKVANLTEEEIDIIAGKLDSSMNNTENAMAIENSGFESEE